MDVEDEQSLEERLRAQNKSSITRGTTKSSKYTLKDEKLQSYTDKNGIYYRIGDHIYLETNKSNEPYSIACILDFRLTRKDHVMLEVCWYYRPSEIPSNLYHLLIEDRYHENQGNNQTSSIKDKQTKDFDIIQDPNIIQRELFISEIKEFYPAIHIKGRCCVAHYQDIQEVRAFKPDPDTFFYILTYNPEARRLANTQGEIRVGPSHQAKLPLLKGCSLSNNNDDLCSLREELLWKNKTSDLDLSMYLQAARSIAAFARMCDRGLADDMYEIAQRDETTIYALTTLHNHDYDRTRAIEALVQCPIPKKIDRKWSDDDQKKFIKGLRQYGKNFFRIRKDLLPHKQTSDLVEYYYLWKKTPQAQSSRPRRRQRPCSTSANLSTTPTPVKQRNAKNNNKDESEHNSDNDDNQTTTDSDEQYCRHCQTTSKDLQTAGRDNHLLCYDCRMFYKKYGELPILDSESSPYLFKPLNETSSSKRKRAKPSQSPDENNSSSTRSKKKSRVNEKLSTIEEDEELTIKKEIKLEEQENEKPSLSSSTTTTINSSLHIKTEDLNSTILTPTPCKQELHSPKILIDHTKQNNTRLLLSSPSSAFSRTSKKSLIPKNFDEYDSLSKLNTIHSTMLSGDVTPIMSSKDNNDLSNDDGNTSDSSTNANQELIRDEGPTPITCDRECYDKSQGIILLQVYDRSMSQNSCARTDIILKRGSRARRKPTEKQQQQESSNPMMMNIKQEDRNLSKLSFSLDKGPPMLHPSGPVLPFSHHDPLSMNRNSPLFHPLPLHALAAGGPKPPLGFPSPFSPSPHDNAALRHLDPLGLRLMNPAQFFGSQSPFSTAGGVGRPTPAGLDPATAALLLDPRYRSMMSPFHPPSPSSMIPPIPSSSSNNSSSSSATTNGTHNHAHIHSHSHTHLHLGNNNDPSSATSNAPPLLPPPPPPPLLSFANPLAGLSHGNPLLHPGGPLPPSSLEAIHNLARERELMTLMFGNNNRFDPMSFALANSFQMPRLEDFSRLNARERSIREYSENELRRLNFDIERQQQQQLRFPFHH